MGLTWLAFLLRIIPSKPNKIVNIGSQISYEMYLVHLFILHCSVYNVFDIPASMPSRFLILLVGSVVSAWLLNILSKKVSLYLQLAAKSIRLL